MMNDKLKDVKKGDPIVAEQYQLLIDNAKMGEKSLGMFKNSVGTTQRGYNNLQNFPMQWSANESLNKLYPAKVLEDPEDAGEVWVEGDTIHCDIYLNLETPYDGLYGVDWIKKNYAVKFIKKGSGTFKAGTLVPVLEVGDVILVQAADTFRNVETIGAGNGNQRIFTGALNERPLPGSVYFYGYMPENLWKDEPNRYLSQISAGTFWPSFPFSADDLDGKWQGLLTGNLRLDEVLSAVPEFGDPAIATNNFVNYRGTFSFTIAWQEPPPASMRLVVIYTPISAIYFTWVQTADTVQSFPPSGTVSTFAGATIPDGYLECNGQSVSSITYPDLYSAIGTIYGGDGAPNFLVPDLRRAVPRGYDPDHEIFVGDFGDLVDVGCNEIGKTGGHSALYLHHLHNLTVAFSALYSSGTQLRVTSGVTGVPIWDHGEHNPDVSYPETYVDQCDNRGPWVAMKYMIKT